MPEQRCARMHAGMRSHPAFSFLPYPCTLTSELSFTKPCTSHALQGAHVTDSLDAAMAVLAGPSLAERIESVFVIGGGQIYTEALASPLCSAVHFTQARPASQCRPLNTGAQPTCAMSSMDGHNNGTLMASSSGNCTGMNSTLRNGCVLTLARRTGHKGASSWAAGAQIDADVECDTFFPELRRERWRLWSAAPPRRDNGTRYAFHCYVPAGAAGGSGRAPALPPALAARHEECQVSTGAARRNALFTLLSRTDNSEVQLSCMPLQSG